MINTVIFDFDGTLADTNQVIINSFKHIFQMYGKKYDEDYILTTFGEPLKDVISRDFGDHNVEEVLEEYIDYQGNKFEEEVNLYDSVLDTLVLLADQGLKLGVVTSRLKDGTLEALDRFDIISYFDSIVTVDDVNNPKPHAEPVLKGVEELNSSTKNTVYVGDSSIDMICSKNAGVTPILVGWHQHSQEIAEEHGVKHVISKMPDLIDVLEGIRN